MKQRLNLRVNRKQKSQMAVLHYRLIVVMLVSSANGFAQNNNIQFGRLENNSDISNSNVTSIIQDSRGFMWFGTFDGLNRYDGYEFTIYKNIPNNENSLSSNSIKSIIEDTDGAIWAGTWGGGLNKFDRKKNKFIHFKHIPGDTNTISSNFVTCLLEDEKGNIWIGTGEGSLDLFDRGNNTFIHYVHPNDSNSPWHNYVTSVFEDSEHNLWIGAINKGIFLFDKKNGTFKAFQHHDKVGSSLCDNNVSVIFEDSSKNLWIGTDNEGLDLMNKNTSGFSHFKKNILTGNSFSDYGILSIAEDKNRNLWIGTRDGGVNVFNPQTGISYNYHHDDLDVTSLARNTVPAIYKDRKKDIWISALTEGINFVSSSGDKFIHYKHNSSKNSLSDNNVLSICEDYANNLWIGTEGGGLNFFDRRLGSFTHYIHQPGNKKSICGNKILAIREDYKHNLWLGTWGEGITVFNRDKNTFRHFKNDPADVSSLGSNNVWTIFEDRNHNIWIGTYGAGLDLYNPENDSFTHYEYDDKNPSSINSNQVITIFEDSKGFLWIGTDGGGLNQFDSKTKSFTHFIHDELRNSLSYNFVSAILEDNLGNLYLATGTGLNYLNTETHHFTDYTVNDDFNFEAVYGIMKDAEGNVWMSRSQGISCFDHVTRKFINFNTEDGLHSNIYGGASCQSRSGMMFFGGNDGFDEFFPGNIKKISFDPPMVITDFQIFNKKVPIAVNEQDPSPLKTDITETKEITIPYSSSVISFEFASLHYGMKDRKKYAYKLENFDKTWNEVGTKRIATYTNLDPGKYILMVKGLNNESEWSAHTINLELIITPPYWLTWWFRSGVLILILGGAFGFYKYRINAIGAQKRKLEQRVQEQTYQLIKSTEEEQRARIEAEQANEELERKNKEMEQFAYIASHDLQEPLRTTSSFVELLQKQYQGKFDERADKYFAFILDASGRMKVLIKNLLDLSRIGHKKESEQVDCERVLENVLADLAVVISETGAGIQYGPLPVINGYAIELKQLFQNLITNAIKFRKKGLEPAINISVEKKKCYWQFAFKDNGIGIEEAHYERIFAIFQRLHTRTEYEGSGIGLSHCKKIVELHRGKIWVESALGEGSTFYFTLPAGEASLPVRQAGIPQKINLGNKNKIIQLEI